RIPTDSPPYHVGGWVTEVAPSERSALWWSGLEVLARIHRLEWRTLGLSFVETPGPGDTPLLRQLNDYERFLAWAMGGEDHPTCTPALAWLRAHRPHEEEPVGFCWGDARPGNMIFQQGRCVAVLDWEMATLGNPVQDLAWWLFLDRHHSEGLGAPRLAGFPSRADTIAAWEERTELPARHVDYYEVFAAFRFAVIMIRVAQGFIAAGTLPPEARLATNNIVTQLLSKMLGLPAPS
ncbi:MAG TPA: phosphotransferase family protein, partial [Myxococcota bacterium]|nr:phosphotransferase family protein [Myxococcota bacterium]